MHHRTNEAAAAKIDSIGVAETSATGRSLAETRLQHPRVLGASICGVPGAQKWTPPRGGLLGLEDQHWQFGAAIQDIQRGDDTPAGKLVAYYGGDHDARRPGPSQ